MQHHHHVGPLEAPSTMRQRALLLALAAVALLVGCARGFIAVGPAPSAARTTFELNSALPHGRAGASPVARPSWTALGATSSIPDEEPRQGRVGSALSKISSTIRRDSG